MRRVLNVLLAASLVAPTVATAAPSIISTDTQTGIILSSNNIDVKQDPYVTGKLALIFIALNDIMTEDLDPDEMISLPNGDDLELAFLLKDAASDSLSSPISLTLIAGKVAQSPNILNERMMSLFREVGMRATSLQTIRTRKGEPSWSGFTTIRDIARLTSALMLTHGDYARAILPKSEEKLWIYRDGLCLAVTSAEHTGRELSTVIQGASSEQNCMSAVDVAVKHNDSRIEAASKRDHPTQE